MIHGSRNEEFATDKAGIAKALESAESVLILTHDRPDGDAVGSSLGLSMALESLGKVISVLMPDGIPYRYSKLKGISKIIAGMPANSVFDATVVLDTGSLDRIGGGLPGREIAGKILNIDHHATNNGFADITWCDPGASSVGELILELLRDHLRIKPGPECAEALFCAILTDTGSFRYSNTSPSALQAAAYLVECGARPDKLSNQIYFSHPAGRVRLLARVLPTLELFKQGRIGLLNVTQEMLDEEHAEISWTDEFIEFVRSIDSVEVALLLKSQRDGKIKVSMRSKGRVNVAEIAEVFKGGGHPHASGATLDGDMRNAIEKVVAEVEKRF
ncbi:MAG: bifunctional oligoribonuclease/PAP phosphatase NrnA [Deltaproteobacteria bacterium]|nr:bifunctional oligoribonuclease/PAP phosphatase NrnA [Deltaproteobacteria bacterium]